MNTMTPKEFVSTLDITHPGRVVVNGVEYLNVQAAREFLQSYEGQVEITFIEVDRKNIQPGLQGVIASPRLISDEIFMQDDKIYQIKVRRYMTQPATPAFTFQSQWNNNIPMPMRIMVGKKVKETKGMVKMQLWGEMVNEVEVCCLKCGKTLTNPVSHYFGLGPECGGHMYKHPFETEDELRAAVEENNEKLALITWEGWIVKSAIEIKEIVRDA